ncbi:MAG: disulfide bond formation protein B [Haloarcula sp.]
MVESRFIPDRPRLLLAAATAVAIGATVASLYLSLGLGLTPCRLCWYQRILMYPLVVVLGIATGKGDPGVVQTALPLSALGSAIAAYHSWLQVSQTTCGIGAVSCAQIQYRILGLTVPNFSLVAFLLIGVAVVAATRPFGD